ncbi:MAG: adenylate/guanylate cyclase domain-containing protein, partial [bacterium]|nr:adenylate/guanylate cyclase domain-containing protein [bacterium]
FLFGNEYNADYNVNTSTAFRFHAKSSLISDYDYRKYVKESVKADDLLMNLEDICYGAGGFGYLNVNQDDDGPIRSAPAAIFFKDMYFPSLPLEVARMHLKIPNEEVIVVPGHRIEIGNEIVLPTDENLNFMINYYGPFQTFKYYSFIDVMSKEIPEYELKGKIVLVGVTGTGLTDVQITPFSTEEKANLPGIEIHANIVESIISNNFFIESNSAFFVMIKFLVLILFGVIIILIISKTKFITSFVLTGITTYIYFFISQVLFNKFGLILQSIYPVMLVLMVYISVSMFKYIVEEREKRYIKKAFAYYLSPNVLKEVLANPELLKLTSKRSELTIMFIDVKSFTTYSEAHTPEEVAGNLNVLLTLMTNLVLENNGTLDKYIGDCLMGFWGAPVWFEDHAYWACKTGLLILKRIDEERKKREAEGKDFFEIGIGMNTGECVVGNMGSDMIMDYTVIGDAVNTASRVEGLTRIYDRPFVITEFTYTKVKEWAEVEELGDATVKGKTKTFKVYNLISLKEKGGKK